MIKLYKKINNIYNYWETWENDDSTSIIHWGIVGELGENISLKNNKKTLFNPEVKKELDDKITEGFLPIEDDNKITLAIQYSISGFGSEKDLEKRNKLENLLNELLGWYGLGHCDGGSSGSSTMEIFCIVVDFYIAKKIISEKLNNTIFSDYTRIYDSGKE